MLKGLVLCGLLGLAMGSYDFSGYYGYMTPEYINAASAPYYINPVPAATSVFPKEASPDYTKEALTAPAAPVLSKEAPAVAVVKETAAPAAYPKEAAPAVAVVPQTKPKEVVVVPEKKLETPIVEYAKPSVQYPIDYYAKPKYQFKYEVDDCHTGDKKSHQEERDGDNTKGQYSVHQPDGTILTVDYSVIGNGGYNAVVKRTGKPYYPPPVLTKKVFTALPIYCKEC